MLEEVIESGFIIFRVAHNKRSCTPAEGVVNGAQYIAGGTGSVVANRWRSPRTGAKSSIVGELPSASFSSRGGV
jgi:hypothetical protein